MPSTEWQTVYVFISSTFNDMHAERDYMVKRVFPLLGDWCEPRRLHLVDVDLRWGVTEADATRHRNVVNVCLDRIDQSRPFFLCFVGQRYGWVPGPEDVAPQTFDSFPGLADAVSRQRSVTHMEMLYAASRSFGEGLTASDGRREDETGAFFYFRDRAYFECLPTEPTCVRRIYSDLAEPDKALRQILADRLREMKEDAVSTGRPVRIYRAEWLPDQRTPELALSPTCSFRLPENQKRWRRAWKQHAGIDVRGLDVAESPDYSSQAKAHNERRTRGRLGQFDIGGRPLAEAIVEDLKAAIEARYPGRAAVHYGSDLEREIDQHQAHAALAERGFVSRPDDFSALDGYADDESRQIFALVSPPGMGKSTLLACWLRRRLRTATSRETVHARFVGVGERSNAATDVLRSLLREAQSAGKLDSVIPNDPRLIRSQLVELLARCGQNGKTIFVIDGIDQLAESLSETSWLPAALPRGVKLVVSFRLGDGQCDRLVAGWRESGAARVCQLRAFEELDARRRLVRGYFSRYLKDLDGLLLETLIAVAGAANPLYLQIVVAELRVFGAFEQLGARVESDFGQTPVDAFESVLRRMETDEGDPLLPPGIVVPAMFHALALVRNGLSEDEILAILARQHPDRVGAMDVDAAQDVIKVQLRQVRRYLSSFGRVHRIRYDSLRQASRRVYDRRRSQSECHADLAEVFRSLAQQPDFKAWRGSPRAVRELPYHLARGRRWDALVRLIEEDEFVAASEAAGWGSDLRYVVGLAIRDACLDGQHGAATRLAYRRSRLFPDDTILAEPGLRCAITLAATMAGDHDTVARVASTANDGRVAIEILIVGGPALAPEEQARLDRLVLSDLHSAEVASREREAIRRIVTLLPVGVPIAQGIVASIDQHGSFGIEAGRLQELATEMLERDPRTGGPDWSLHPAHR